MPENDVSGAESNINGFDIGITEHEHGLGESTEDHKVVS